MEAFTGSDGKLNGKVLFPCEEIIHGGIKFGADAGGEFGITAERLSVERMKDDLPNMGACVHPGREVAQSLLQGEAWSASVASIFNPLDLFGYVHGFKTGGEFFRRVVVSMF